MTEDKWLTATNPQFLLLHVKRTPPGLRTRAAQRKFRLYGCACASRILGGADHESLRSTVEVAEHVAEGMAKNDRLIQARTLAWRHVTAVGRDTYPNALYWTAHAITDVKAWVAARVWRWVAYASLNQVRGNTPQQEKRILTTILRCIFGNPFRPVGVDPNWLTPTATQLAQGIYDDRAFDRLPILADALQDAGCNSDDILNHCRGGGPHARGCWVVDLVLGKA